MVCFQIHALHGLAVFYYVLNFFGFFCFLFLIYRTRIFVKWDHSLSGRFTAWLVVLKCLVSYGLALISNHATFLTCTESPWWKQTWLNVPWFWLVGLFIHMQMGYCLLWCETDWRDVWRTNGLMNYKNMRRMILMRTSVALWLRTRL